MRGCLPREDPGTEAPGAAAGGCKRSEHPAAPRGAPAAVLPGDHLRVAQRAALLTQNGLLHTYLTCANVRRCNAARACRVR